MKTRPAGRADFLDLYIYYFKFRGVDRQIWGKYISCELSSLGRKSAVEPLDKISLADQAANSHIPKYFTRNHRFFKDLAGYFRKSLTSKDHDQGGLQTEEIFARQCRVFVSGQWSSPSWRAEY